jgi:hypothetical protein
MSTVTPGTGTIAAYLADYHAIKEEWRRHCEQRGWDEAAEAQHFSRRYGQLLDEGFSAAKASRTVTKEKYRRECE